jgi:hypothetical protein
MFQVSPCTTTTRGFESFLRPPERIELGFTEFERLPAFGKSGKGLNVVAAGEVLAVTKEDRCPERGIVVEIEVGLGQTVKCLRVDSVEHLRSIDADEDDLLSPLHRDLGVWR